MGVGIRSSSCLRSRAVTLQASTVEASSELGTQWVAENLIDGNLATEWQDRSLSGRGAVLTFRFSQPVAISEIEIYNLPDDARFRQNHRIRGYRITVDDLSYDRESIPERLTRPGQQGLNRLLTL